MAIFAIIHQPGKSADQLLTALVNGYGENKVMGVADGTWLLAASGTAQEVSQHVGITEGQAGSAMVLEVASYFGRANPSIWSWMKTNWEDSAGG